MNLYYQSLISTPIGEIMIQATETAIVEVAFDAPPATRPDNALTREAKAQLAAYFAGKHQTFDLPLAPKGTLFQRQAWAALQQIPYGETWYYAQQALHINHPKAVRAIGAANGANPIGIIIPCHRVIGKNGTLTGYGGGLDRKQWLLALEGEHMRVRGRLL